MKYRNEKTGNVIDIESTFHGKEWEPVEAPTSPAVAPVQPKRRKRKVVKES